MASHGVPFVPRVRKKDVDAQTGGGPDRPGSRRDPADPGAADHRWIVTITFAPVARVRVDSARARVFEHGWQSWSPAAGYAVDATSYRPVGRAIDTMAYRPGRPLPARGLQGEGLLALDPGDGGPVSVWAAP